MLPKRVIHADWSADPRKRWMAQATLGADGHYTASAPEFVRDPGLFALSLLDDPESCVLVGFDFPIGLPITYARKAKIDNFLDALAQFGEGKWAQFYQVAATRDEISLYRPFYPASPGGKLHDHLTSALGIGDLRRQCDRQTDERRAAAELFWTIGAQQVGKAAISGWKEILAPALKMRGYLQLAIWPFSGTLASLLKPGWIVACEAYPGEFYGHLGVRFPRKAGAKSGKRVQTARIDNAPVLLGFADSAGIRLEPVLVDAIRDGFGGDALGEDRFDSLVGLFGMLNVVLGRRPPGDPRAPEVAHVEGWILGMTNLYY
ncbi:MAG: hypothetical protein U0521_24100 [Anaerolineae bacterium]